jgi:ketosteroid isomerase-like protein
MPADAEIIELTKRLLVSIASQDWQTYTELCAEDLTAFEPECLGQLIEGLGFHEFYFQQKSSGAKANFALSQPHVRWIGKDAAVICYVRLVQVAAESGVQTFSYEETRVWQQIDGKWKHVHFHRSPAS